MIRTLLEDNLDEVARSCWALIGRDGDRKGRLEGASLMEGTVIGRVDWKGRR